MKKDCITYLYDLANMGFLVWQNLSMNKNVESELILKNSFSTNASCLTLTYSMFITPIDREDIATFSLMLHRFNAYSVDLSSYKQKHFPNRDIKKFASPIIKIRKKLCDVFKDKFPTSPDSLIHEIEHLPEEDHQIGFSPMGLIAEHNLFEKIERCYFHSIETVDKIICALIKNV